MIRKILAAAALATLASSPAFALTNPGFEDSLGANPTGWITPIGALSSVASGTVVSVIDDTGVLDPMDVPGSTGTLGGPITLFNRAVSAMNGSNFGLLETCPASVAVDNCTTTGSFSFNLGGPVSAVGDLMWVRLFTADYDPYYYNDSVTVSYYGTSSPSALAVDTISVASMATDGAAYDSGWKGFAVPVGTSTLMIQLNNVAQNGAPATDAYFNRPIAALDYTPAAAPVPEADVTAMMLAGLGVLGLVARRRGTKKA